MTNIILGILRIFKLISYIIFLWFSCYLLSLVVGSNTRDLFIMIVFGYSILNFLHYVGSK